MARFEVTTSNGEKILLDHDAGGMAELLSALNANSFILGNEVGGHSMSADRPIILASGQVLLVRLLDNLSTQSSTFRPKR